MKTKISKISNCSVLPQVGGTFIAVKNGATLGMIRCPNCDSFFLSNRSDDIEHFICEKCDMTSCDKDLIVNL